MHLKTYNIARGVLPSILIAFFSYPLPKITISQRANHNELHISYHFDVKPKDYLYKDFLHFSVDHPAITLSEWKVNHEPLTCYDPLFKKNKQVFDKPCTLQITATRNNSCTSACLYCTYYQKSEKKIKQLITPLIFEEPTSTDNTIVLLKNEYINMQTKATLHAHYSFIDEIRNIYITPCIALLGIALDKFFMLPYARVYAGIITILIMACILLFFIFMRKRKPILFTECKNISTNVLICITVAYVLSRIQPILYPLVNIMAHIFLLLFTGLFFMQKSTCLQSKTMRHLCTLIGFVTLAYCVFVSFRMYQLLE